MQHHTLELSILAQPDDFTCGPTCLHALYNYYGDHVELDDVIKQVRRLDHGGTLAVLLGIHALQRGYTARLYSYNLEVFDPTWFSLTMGELHRRLAARMEVRPEYKQAIEAYIEFLELGGLFAFEDLTPALIRKYLNRGTPILTGLSSTYLYRAAREWGPNDDSDDITGDPQGHFVVLCGYNREDKTVLVADPMENNPAFKSQLYAVDIERLRCSILLGILTHDGNLLIVEPAAKKKQEGGGPNKPATDVDAHRRQ